MSCAPTTLDSMTSQTPEPRLVTVADGVHAWIGAGGDSNAGAIETPEGLLIVDAQQYPRLGRALREAALERTGQPLRLVINTHCHLDHTHGNVVFADRHEVKLIPDGAFAKILGCDTIRVNSLHGQGIDVPGKRIVVEGVAEDGTIEAIRVAEAPGFALGVQWHAEYEARNNPVNRKLFEAFGRALTEGRRAA